MFWAGFFLLLISRRPYGSFLRLYAGRIQQILLLLVVIGCWSFFYFDPLSSSTLRHSFSTLTRLGEGFCFFFYGFYKFGLQQDTRIFRLIRSTMCNFSPSSFSSIAATPLMSYELQWCGGVRSVSITQPHALGLLSIIQRRRVTYFSAIFLWSWADIW